MTTPSLLIHWESMSACIDVVCSHCEKLYHVDTDEDVYVECPNCGHVLDLPTKIEVPSA